MLPGNNIGVGGVALLLGVLHHQQDMLLQMTSDPSSGRKTSATGLLRLTLQVYYIMLCDV